MSDSAYRWIIRGTVQGVGYRHFARVSGVELGLRGWVRNLADGTVEVLVAGSEEDVRALERRLSAGPRWAEVRGIEEEEVDGVALPSRFEVRF